MAKPRITLIGLGETGAAIGLALLKEAGDYELVGYDRSGDAEAEAKRLGAVHRTEWNLHTAVEGASLVVLSLPLPALVETFGHIADDLAPEALVFATGGLLRPITEAAERLLPNHRRVVAGHPIRLVPPGAPSAETFANVTFCIAAPASAEPASVELASDLVERVGATPHFVDMDEHDGIMAAVEQLPQLVGAALVSLNAQAPGWREMRQLAGRRFGQAGSLPDAPAAAAAAFALNRTALLARLNDFERELAQWRTLIENAAPLTFDAPTAPQADPSKPAPAASPLQAALEQVADEHETWAKAAATQAWENPAGAPTPKNGLLRQLFLGNIGRRKNNDDRARK